MNPFFFALFLLTLPAIAADDNSSSAFPPPPLPKIPDKIVKISDYGAVGDGMTDCTQAIQKAVQDVLAAGGGTVEVPDGTFLMGPLTLGSCLRLHLSDKATLKMLPLGTYPHNADGSSYPAFIGAADGHDIEISGGGTIDGEGEPWWIGYRAKQVQRRPALIYFQDCHTLYFHGFHTLNPPNIHFGIARSKNVTFDAVNVSAPGDSPNTDGLNLGNVHDVLVENCTIATGDDNIVLLTSHKQPDGPGCTNVYISKCKLGVGHGLSFGSYTSGGIENVTVTDCSFEGTTSGIRLKAGRGRGGLVQNIVYDRITMQGVRTPIALISYYPKPPKRGTVDPSQPIDDNTPIWKNITIRNLVVKDSSEGGVIWGLPEMPVSNLVFENVSTDSKTGWYISNASDVIFRNSKVTVAAGAQLQTENATVTGLDPAQTSPESEVKAPTEVAK